MSKHDAWLHGEIGDDGSHPNSPNYREPEFDMSDAAANVVEILQKFGDLPALVEEVAKVHGLLVWIAHNAEVPARYCDDFNTLAERAKALNKAVGDEYDVLNGRAA